MYDESVTCTSDACNESYPFWRETCPLCRKPNPVTPNVYQATLDEERKALHCRSKDALDEAASRGAGGTYRSFEAECRKSKVVINRYIIDLLNILSPGMLHNNWYQITRSGEQRLPRGSKFDQLRQNADNQLLPFYGEEICFGALTLDNQGLWSYGSVTMVIESMVIKDRASVMYENSVDLAEKLKLSTSDPKTPAGFRACWDDRHVLCAVKHGKDLEPDTPSCDFPKILIKRGEDTESDDFVEVHIYGTFKAEAIEQLVLNRTIAVGRGEEALISGMREYAGNAKIPLLEVCN